MTKLILFFVTVVSVQTSWAQETVETNIGPGPAVEVKSIPPDDSPSAQKPLDKKAKAVADKTVKDDKENGDTYNFYFQKGSGPGSVEQGRDQQKVDGPKTETRTDHAQGEIAFTLPKFEGHLGPVLTPASSGAGLSIGGQFNASKTVGFQFHLITMKFSNGSSSSSFSARGSDDKKTTSSALGGSTAFVFTPVTFAESKIPVRISGLLGAMFLSTTVEEERNKFSAMGSEDTTTTSKESKFLGFVGVSATAYITKRFGIVGYGKLTSEPNYSQIGLSASWLL